MFAAELAHNQKEDKLSPKKQTKRKSPSQSTTIKHKKNKNLK